MSTERPSPRFADIDTWEPLEVLEAMIGGQFAAVAAVRAVLPVLARAALAAEARLKRGNGRLVYVGAGTSGRLAVQDGAELAPTFGWPRERLLLLIAGGSAALMQAVEGAEDQAEQAAELVNEHRLAEEDVLVAVAASGTTPFTVSCLRTAGARGALTVALANNAPTPRLESADHPVYLDTGAEPIAGSTRMNAGTAQRITLALFSTLVMVRLGRVYRGLMIDLQAANAKLSRRKNDILGHLTGRDEPDVQDALVTAGGDIKIAVLLLNGCELDEARELLHRAGGELRSAIGMLPSGTKENSAGR